jgi:ABC-type transport system substrate-binding protein
LLAAPCGQPAHPEHQGLHLSRAETTLPVPAGHELIFINPKNLISKNVAVRCAMAHAVNRACASKIGEYGYEPPAN